MPNWCSNTLEVTGPRLRLATDKDALKDFELTARGLADGEEETALCFQSLHPMPEDKEEQLKGGKDCYLHEYGNKFKDKETHEDKLRDAWYHWHIHNWGTKWEAGEVCLTRTSVLLYEFDTAWGPPMALLDKVSKDYPTLRFEIWYVEPGMWFAGRKVWVGGAVVEEMEGDPEEFEFCRALVDAIREDEEEYEAEQALRVVEGEGCKSGIREGEETT